MLAQLITQTYPHLTRTSIPESDFTPHEPDAMPRTTMRDYGFTAINKHWSMKFIFSSTAQYSKTAETKY